VHQELVGIQSSNEARRAGHVALTSPNAAVEPIHAKAIPVILTTDQERDVSPGIGDMHTVRFVTKSASGCERF
jgi:hypothetical protein